MKLDRWAQLAEIAASIAVVATLIILTLEVRANTRALEGQAVRERSAALNDAYVRSPLIPSILAKIKEVDGPEPGETVLMDRYGLSYEEAAIWGRYLSQIWTGLEAEYLSDGPSPELRDRIQLLFLFPDAQVNWDFGAAPQVQDLKFREYVAKLTELPPSEWVAAYQTKLEALRAR
ncbi:MAG: hypothetical protein P8Y21_12485 [Gemmatimonadales bacterium]|jgi:hypothetical protein